MAGTLKARRGRSRGELDRLIRGLRRADKTTDKIEARAQSNAPAPLSYSQERLWFLEKLAPGTAAYNVPGGLRLRGALDADALERALAAIVQRHAVLRTRFVEIGGEPKQVAAARLPVGLPRIDLGALPAAGSGARARPRGARAF